MRVSAIKRHKKALEISSWLTFAISLTIYWITADPGASYWDCPEYVIAASRMEIGHPPGNPIWMLAMRIATLPFPIHSHAFIINLCSGLFMAFATFFLCRIVFMAVRISVDRNQLRINFTKKSRDIVAGAVSLGGALCFAFCDSAWFSAVEAEVYALSAMLTSAALWIMVVWWFETSSGRRWRLLVLLAYLTGLSLGVHQLNLLCIPVYLLIIFYRRNPDRLSPQKFILAVACGILIIVLILFVIMPGLLKWAGMFELLFVNQLAWPYNSGVIIFLLTLLVLFFVGIGISWKAGSFKTASGLIMAAAIILGFSSFGIIMIRSMANPFMNEGDPSDIFALSSYISREQYPAPPLLYGQTPYSSPMLQEEVIGGKESYKNFALSKGKPIYMKSAPGALLGPRSPFISQEDSAINRKILERKGDGYLTADYRFSQVLTPELNIWLPRITSRNPSDRDSYADWAGMTEETMLHIPVSTAVDSLGNPISKMNSDGEREQEYSYRPTYAQNLRFFIEYQAFYMYFRYLLWNFMGRQNDYPSTGEIDHGNFITGFNFIDREMIGDIDVTPDEIGKDNPGRNNYYSIPFLIALLGAAGLAAQSRKSRRILAVVLLFFFMTGLAIVIYLNQTPGEPRERDYSFLGSYMAFAMLIGAGILMISKGLGRLLPQKLAVVAIFLFSLFPATLLGIVNFDDHDRRGRFETTFYASSILDFEEPAILFTHGDNSTFPVWYGKEIMGMGDKILPVDVTYMNVPSYIANLQWNSENPLRLTCGPEDIRYGRFSLLPIEKNTQTGPMQLKEALTEVFSRKSSSPVFPASQVIIPSTEGDSLIINLNDITGGSNFLSFKQLVLLDMMANAPDVELPRALFFPLHIDWKLFKGIKKALKPALFGKIYAPHLSNAEIRSLFAKSVDRELEKLENLKPSSHYTDPVTADKSRRYRGELIIAANQLIDWNDIPRAKKIIGSIENHFPYKSLSAGDFTVEDSTFYEGKEYIRLNDRIFEITGEKYFKDISAREENRAQQRRIEWLKYYESLKPSQRATLSNRSKRRLL